MSPESPDDEQKKKDRKMRDIREIGTKKGLVWLIGVETFTQHALKRGIHGPSTLTDNVNPYSAQY